MDKKIRVFGALGAGSIVGMYVLLSEIWWEPIPFSHAIFVILFSSMAYWGMFMALPRPLTIVEQLRKAGVQDPQAVLAIAEAMQRTDTLEAKASKLKEERAEKVMHIVSTMRKMIEIMVEDNSKVSFYGEVLYKHLPSITNLLVDFTDFKKKFQDTERFRAMESDFDHSLNTTVSLFENKYDDAVAAIATDVKVQMGAISARETKKITT